MLQMWLARSALRVMTAGLLGSGGDRTEGVHRPDIGLHIRAFCADCACNARLKNECILLWEYHQAGASARRTCLTRGQRG